MENVNLKLDNLTIPQSTFQVEAFIDYFTSLNGKEQRSIIKQLENIYLPKGNKADLVKGLVIDRIAKHKGGKYMKFFISNIDAAEAVDFNNLIVALYPLLYTNTKFKTFSRHKILDIKGKLGSKYVLVSKDCRISNLTSRDEFTRVIKRNTLDQTGYYNSLELVIWKERFKPKNKDGLSKNDSIV